MKVKKQPKKKEEAKMGSLNEHPVLSVAPTTFRGDDGQPREMFKVYIADATGAVGCIYSRRAYQPGDIVQLEAYAKSDGKFAVRISS